jgi:hypothetical protein
MKGFTSSQTNQPAEYGRSSILEVIHPDSKLKKEKTGEISKSQKKSSV